MLGKIWYILLTYVVNSFCFSLNIPVLISILQEKIKILLQKMLKGTHLSWLCNDASEKNNSLNDRFKKPRINWWLVPFVTQTRGRAFSTFARAFDFLLRLQKLGRAFERLSRVFWNKHPAEFFVKESSWKSDL